MTATESTSPRVIRVVTFLGDKDLDGLTYTYNGKRSETETRLPWHAWMEIVQPPAGVDPAVLGICSEGRLDHWTDELGRDARTAGFPPDSLGLGLLSYPTAALAGEERDFWPVFELIRVALSEGPVSGTKDFHHLAGQMQSLDQEPDLVLVDITHGFRALPFLGAAVLAFLQAANRRGGRHINYRICYAAADSLDEHESAPVWNLSPFFELTGLGAAVDAFMHHGRADDIAEFFKASSSNAANALAEPMQAFADDSLLMRVPAILKTSAPKLNTEFDAQLADVIRAYPPVKQDLEELHARIGELIGTADRDAAMTKAGLKATLALAERLWETGRCAELYNLLRESLITAFGVVALKRPEEHPQPGTTNSWKPFREHLENDCRNVGQLQVDTWDGKKGIGGTLKSHYVDPKNMPGIALEIAKELVRVRDGRNDVAHCSMADKAEEQSKLKADLRKSLDDFRAFVERIQAGGK